MPDDDAGIILVVVAVMWHDVFVMYHHKPLHPDKSLRFTFQKFLGPFSDTIFLPEIRTTTTKNRLVSTQEATADKNADMSIKLVSCLEAPK